MFVRTEMLLSNFIGEDLNADVCSRARLNTKLLYKQKLTNTVYSWKHKLQATRTRAHINPLGRHGKRVINSFKPANYANGEMTISAEFSVR